VAEGCTESPGRGDVELTEGTFSAYVTREEAGPNPRLVLTGPRRKHSAGR